VSDAHNTCPSSVICNHSFSENSFVSSAHRLYRSKSSELCTLQAVATPNK
jgi:hypothetical protein